MSCLFEGILSPTSLTEAEKFLGEISTNIVLKLGEINDSTYVFCRWEPLRNKFIFLEEMEYVASQVSISTSSTSLLIRYDGRVSYRSLILFENGVLSQVFDEFDEIWVRLDENGEPNIGGGRFSNKDVESDNENEYEILTNAIELGLNILGCTTWNEVLRFMSSAWWKDTK
ncbi:MAG: hypothetical protein NW224_00010 [Leptolyngbyaceae cyanobacterium bins.302]|nr:hypothetical protein [Leptolyngbyaceae cyanobacterium bins.302]